ncbi:MAG: type III-B CRISPR module RAMP protein Cmr1 [Puniceicoccales bacterium]|jgi:CRISPR-associated protein Cmr1|nr:type III-B CRISPR module RAMP protein Cmr1 [Puniceicoccales bacterium]
MKTATYNLTFLTPCFCAGADQARAELRAPSIRGQLRWWFRALGGTRDEETEIFGGLGDGDPAASRVVVRVSDLKRGAPWQPPRVDPNNPSSYVWYFASASADKARWTADGALPPGTSFKLHILFRRELPESLAAIGGKFDNALKAFLALGGIGLRVTRGLGAFTCAEFPFAANEQTVRQILTGGTGTGSTTGGGFKLEKRNGDNNAPFPDLNAVVREIGSLVKGTRGALGMKATRPSPFGASTPRQTSAIYFRPVVSASTAGTGNAARAAGAAAATPLSLVIFEAPHNRVLAKDSRTPRPTVGATPSKLTRAQPSAAPRRW